MELPAERDNQQVLVRGRRRGPWGAKIAVSTMRTMEQRGMCDSGEEEINEL